MNTVTPYPVGLDPRLLRTKLTAPAAVGRQIVREPIVEALCTSNARLVLLRAPAGFGKSTVMLQCREHAIAFQEGFGTWGGLSEDERARLLQPAAVHIRTHRHG